MARKAHVGRAVGRVRRVWVKEELRHPHPAHCWGSQYGSQFLPGMVGVSLGPTSVAGLDLA